MTSERTAAGVQRLIPGVAPVTDRQRAEARAAKPLHGGNAPPPAGGLFDEAARHQLDLAGFVEPPRRPPTRAKDPKATLLPDLAPVDYRGQIARYRNKSGSRWVKIEIRLDGFCDLFLCEDQAFHTLIYVECGLGWTAADQRADELCKAR